MLAIENSHLRNLFVGALVFHFSFISISEAVASGQQVADDQVFIEEVMKLYDLDEASAIERLAHEGLASELYAQVRSMNWDGYAGAWFDEEQMLLKVAVASPTKGVLQEMWQMGAVPVRVRYNLRTLKAEAVRLRDAFDPIVLETFVDYPKNQIVASIHPDYFGRVSLDAFRSELEDSAFRLVRSDGGIQLTSGPVRGADGIKNIRYLQSWGVEHPCSIGVAAEGGYFTAGHCGWHLDAMGDENYVKMGHMYLTTYTFGTDSGLVKTDPGWWPTPVVNGYSDGLIYVPGLWAGLLEAPLNTTVFRYGQSTLGPVIGTIAAKGVNGGHYGIPINNMTRVSTANCPIDGDSGGPFLSTGGQVQGTTIGGSDPCPHPTHGTTTYFQPIHDSLASSSHIPWANVVTMHGPNAPAIVDFVCPDMGSSGGGAYVCHSKYSAQGVTQMLWNHPGGQHTSMGIVGTCSSGNVSVSLTVTSPHGQDTRNVNFPCPTGPIP